MPAGTGFAGPIQIRACGPKETPLPLEYRQQQQKCQEPAERPPIAAARRSWIGISVADTIGSAIVASGEIQQLFLRVREPALGRDPAKPMCELAVMLSGIS